jgi:uncharacterized protein with von Willebrand factor type A (vWA) domain
MNDAAAGGKLAENMAYFARALRKAGLPIGPGKVLEAIAAVEATGFTAREDLYWVLHAIFVSKRDQSIVFDQAFRLFWRRRALLERMMAMMVPYSPLTRGDQAQKPLNRVADALFGNIRDNQPQEQPKLQVDATMTVSDQEIFRKKDFEQMTAEELAEARRAIERLVLPFDAVPIRRLVPAAHGRRIDPRRSFRASIRGGGMIDLKLRAPGTRKPPIVAICDISGSMGDYSRMFLHFLHALSKSGRKVHSFVFATELTNVSRSLKQNKDPDIALAECVRQVRDWDGGTRISTTLERFNKRWGRRVLGGGATVVLISDGLERSVGDELAREMDRLHRSCRRLIWLNPLLRYDAFQAKAGGIRAMLPHVDEFRTAHNLAAMESLCAALAASRGSEADPRRWLRRAA